MPKFNLILHVPATVEAVSPTAAKALLEMAGRNLAVDGGHADVCGSYSLEVGDVTVSTVRGSRPQPAKTPKAKKEE